MIPYYQDDWVTIYHGDNADIDVDCDMVFADPPYNVSLGKSAHSERQEGYASVDDDMSGVEYAAFINGFMGKWADGDVMVVTPGNSNQHLYPQPKWTMAWTKRNGVSRTPLTVGQHMNHSCWEPIMIYGKLKNPPKFDVIDCSISRQTAAEGHPCPKPIKLMSAIVCAGSNEGETIVDIFMGSGTTLRAAKDLNRKAIGIEIEEKYCEIAANRMSQEVLAF